MTSSARSSDADPMADAPKPAAAMTDPAITERYRVIETLASGVEDATFLCRRLDTEALVELRVLSGKLGGDRLVGAAVRQQATVVARIASQCSGIAMVHECERAANGELVLVMAHPEGPSLRDVLRRDGALGASRALELAIEIAQELERAHSFGLVHGGLRPENVVLVNAEESIVLTHVGFDWLLQSHSAVAAVTAGLRAAPSVYQAPEQASGEAAQQSDVYALGAILYEMLAGTPPSTGPAHRRLNPEPLPNLRPDITPSLGRIIMRALDVDPGRRPGDISTMCNDLWVEAGPTSPAPSAASLAPASPEVGRRTKQLVAVGGLAAIGVVAIWLGHARITSWPSLTAKPEPRPAAMTPAIDAKAPAPRPTPTPANAPGQASPPPPVDTRESEIPESTAAVTLPPSSSLPVAPRSAPSPARPPSLAAPSRPRVTSPPPPAIAPPPRPATAISPRRPEPEPLARSGEPARAAEPPARPQDAAPAEPPKAAPPPVVAAPPAVATPPAAPAPPPPAVSPPPAITTPPAAATPPAVATPPARRDSAEDPGAIIDWLIGGGNAQRR